MHINQKPKEQSSSRRGWYGFDLDGTLAEYTRWKGIDHIGDPIPRMVRVVKRYLEEGRDVRIITARVSPESARIGGHEIHEIEAYIDEWCIKHFGQALPVTCCKDLSMIEMWDDRCIQVVPNTGVAMESLVPGGILERAKRGKYN